MGKEICISTTPHETRLAILEDDQLAEIYYERENEYTLAGSIYKGRVTRVLPGMQSSFVDVGLERDAFLYVTDFLEEQEDSEEYVTENNGRREGRGQRSAGAEESPGRNAVGERVGAERSGGDRGRRGVAPALPSEPGREPRRGREQAVAPLREAVPAEQDLQEKGDEVEEDSPAGTRRWRGRRGRRRGVRAGLPQTEGLLSDTPESLEEASTAEESMAAPFAIAEHGAPGGIASLHASPSAHDEAFTPASRPERGPERSSERGRDRSGRQREPYAQASTFGRPVRDIEPRSAAPVPAIVLPGESISKYGAVTPTAENTQAAPTATAPKSPARPVNYVAPKPSTLVELSGKWDGGSVLPGESISRYGGEEANLSSADAAPRSNAESSETMALVSASHDDHGDPEQAGAAEQASASMPGSADPQGSLGAEATRTSDEQMLGGLDQVDAEAAPENREAALQHAEQAGTESTQARPAPGPNAAPAAESTPLAPLAEPEMVAAAVSPAAEADAPHVAEPHIVASSEHVPNANPVEAAEYEPENDSVSYRVTPPGSVELRLSNPELEQESVEAAPVEAPEVREPVADTAEIAEAQSDRVPDFAGELASVPLAAAQEQQTTDTDLGADVTVLHQDGTIDSAGAERKPETSVGSVARPEETRGSSNDGHPFEAQGFGFEAFEPRLSPEAEVQQADAEQAAGPSGGQTGAPQTSGFSRMVDQLQGFAPGAGLLEEEEVIDEEEYDFEPMHAHLDEHDQEDLEEETLDHQFDQQIEPAVLSDAVRDSHLQHRVHHQVETLSSADTIAEEEDSFGYEEVQGDDEEGEDEEGEPEQSAEIGQPLRGGRTDEGRDQERDQARDHGRNRGRSGARHGGRRNGGGGRSRSAQTQDLPIITDLLKQGQEILVQIAKEPIAKKGARITSHIALPGRFLVFMPTVNHVGVSRKIASDEERQRLKHILIGERGDQQGGFIVRTAADGASEEDLRADLRFLISLWAEIKQRSDAAKAPALIYHDLNLIERILRDQVSSNFSTIWVDSEGEYERIIRFLNRFQPQLVRRVKLYTKETPLFEHFGIQEEISKALKSKVWLKSGGSIVINQTEALVAIDINTGKYVGKTARLEDTIVKTNLDAIPEIVRQIRLRDLGGIIVIDFIDMDERKNRNRVLAALEEELKHDRAPSKVLQFNDFGLVAITRKRVKQSLERTLSVQCEVCTGTGMVKSPTTVCNEIYIELRKMQKHLDGKDVMLRVNPEVVKQLKAVNGKWINELEEMIGKTIIIKSDASLHPEQFDIH